MRAAALLQLRGLSHSSDTEPRARHARRRRHKRAVEEADVTATAAAHTATTTPTKQLDPTVARARYAGGPIDNASYTCACGFVFAASVSTTVRCPHCGADQAW